MFGLPLSFWFGVAFLFGVIVGSFLNVVICRLHTGKSLNGHSHCLSCNHPLAWYELFPLVSYLILRGRCRHCGAWIPARYFAVELATGLGFVLVISHTTSLLPMLLLFITISLLMVITVYDLYHMIIPNELVLALTGLGLGLVVYEAQAIMSVLYALVSGSIAFASFGALWLYSRGRWIGFGDAKLAFPLGIMAGLSATFSLIVFSFWIGAFIAIGILLLQQVISRGQKHLRFLPQTLKMKSEIPFAPFLIASFLLVYFYGVDALVLTSHFSVLLYEAI